MDKPPTTRSHRPYPAGGIWDYVSPSRLNLWLRCPLAFRFRYVDGITGPTSPALLLGQVVHLGIEWYYRHRQLGAAVPVTEVVRQVGQLWGQVVDRTPNALLSSVQECALRRQAMDLVSAYVNHVAQEEVQPLAIEALLEAPLVHPDTGRDLGLPLLGIVDLLLDHQEGPLIADIKTTSRRSTPVDVVHEIQLTCYAYLVRQTCDVQESGLEIRALVKTKVPQVQFHRQSPRTQVHFRRLFAVIEAYLDDLRSERFVFRPGWTCSMCEFRDTHCRRWSGETDVPGPRRHALRRSGSRGSGSRLDLSDLINKDDGS
jgi:putative RecB family exonuclease